MLNLALSTALSGVVILLLFQQCSAQEVPLRRIAAEIIQPEEPSTFVAVGLAGFLPLEQSYRLNYSTSVLGMPIEPVGTLLLPISPVALLDISVSYLRRTANFISDTRISGIEIEPGIRFYLEPQRPEDFRIFAMAGVVISHTVVSSSLDATENGDDPLRESVSRTFLPVGGDVGLGLSYPIGQRSWIDGIVRTTIFFGSPSTSGGLGNIGGVSLIAQYRFPL